MLRTCATCGIEFNGRSNALYCCIRCRKKKEIDRRWWDGHACAVGPDGFYARSLTAARSKKSRVHWRARWDEARAALGERP